MAQDYTCIGMAGTRRQYTNPATTVCMSNQIFFLAEYASEWSWGARVSDNKKIDAVCGLGYEKATPDA